MTMVTKRFRLITVLLPLSVLFLGMSGCNNPGESQEARPTTPLVTIIRSNTEGSPSTADLANGTQNPTVSDSNKTTSTVSDENPGNSDIQDLSAEIEEEIAILVEELGRPITLEERFSYTYGYLIMQTAMRDINAIDPYYFARGALDFGLQKEPYVPKNIMNDVLFEYQDKLISDAAAQLAELSRINLENAEGFLAVNEAREGVLLTESGLQYEVIKASEGPSPLGTDTVKVHYRLTYLDGREGDASIRGIPSTLSLPSLIPGFREGLMLMTVGSEYRFYVHPKLGYGETGSSKIEPNTLLIFDVTLVEIVER
jgi:FKBP-type peptidyl-prolyl cis-trans isomerase